MLLPRGQFKPRYILHSGLARLSPPRGAGWEPDNNWLLLSELRRVTNPTIHSRKRLLTIFIGRSATVTTIIEATGTRGKILRPHHTTYIPQCRSSIDRDSQRASTVKLSRLIRLRFVQITVLLGKRLCQ